MGFAKTPKYKEARLWKWARETWMGDLSRASERFGRELWAWARCKGISGPSMKQLAQSIAALDARALGLHDPSSDTESPIFLLSTGWRAGSTLLQRILVTDPRLLLWGEPLGEMIFLSRITRMLSDSMCQKNWELWRNQDDLKEHSLATSWVATLCPPGDDFRLALRCLFDRWLGEPARRAGFARWGFKEVRLGATEASVLHWLYPHAKFVIISRHPYDCYRSLADAGWHTYFSHPDLPVDRAAPFARCWNRLAVSWSELPPGFPSFHVKYEDLINGKINFRKLESWLGIEIREGLALSASVGGTTKRNRLSWCERLIIAHEAAAGMRTLGYSDQPEAKPEQGRMFQT